MSAGHDESKSASKSADAARNLQRNLICSVGSKVMLLWNISLPLGLVNGSSGVIIDLIYTPTKAPELHRWVSWVPLPPSESEWYGGDNVTHFIKQFPITLAWALTTWKAQGMTCSGKVYAEFPNTEKAGLSYVNLSRLTLWINLCIGRAITEERLTTKISKCKGLTSRMQEDERLRLLWQSTKEFFRD